MTDSWDWPNAGTITLPYQSGIPIPSTAVYHEALFRCITNCPLKVELLQQNSGQSSSPPPPSPNPSSRLSTPPLLPAPGSPRFVSAATCVQHPWCLRRLGGGAPCVLVWVGGSSQFLTEVHPSLLSRMKETEGKEASKGNRVRVKSGNVRFAMFC